LAPKDKREVKYYKDFSIMDLKGITELHKSEVMKTHGHFPYLKIDTYNGLLVTYLNAEDSVTIRLHDTTDYTVLEMWKMDDKYGILPSFIQYSKKNHTFKKYSFPDNTMGVDLSIGCLVAKYTKDSVLSFVTTLKLIDTVNFINKLKQNLEVPIKEMNSIYKEKSAYKGMLTDFL
jgi:hypothetical protein